VRAGVVCASAWAAGMVSLNSDADKEKEEKEKKQKEKVAYCAIEAARR
jgi:hypothetical protein